MFTLAQVRELLKEGLHVRFNGDRVVWIEDGLCYADGKSRMVHAYSSDEAGIDWQTVNPGEERHLTLITTNPHYGGVFYVKNCEGPVAQVRVVKFNDPGPVNEMRIYPHFVVIYSAEPLECDAACEMAIDLLINHESGIFNEVTAQPQLVV